MKVDYFYGAQVERIMKHMIRLFGNFSVSDGFDANGKQQLRRVPCRNGDISRQAAVQLHENSENKLPSAPFITVSISSMNISRANVRSPMTNQTVVGVNKQDPVTKQHSNQLEGYYEIERFNPVPWDFEFQIDIWTTNQQNKFELFEQIATLFAPTVPLQLGTNPLDPTSFAYLELMGYNHTSRSFPQGTDYNLDISQFQMKTMVFLSLPQRVNRAQLISQIVTSMNLPAINDLNLPTLTNWQTVATDVYSPGNHMVELTQVPKTTNYVVKLLTKHGIDNSKGRVLSWDKLLTYYHPEYKNVQMRLVDTLENDTTQIIGTLTNTETPNEMLLTVDANTFDAATLPPVNNFLDPTKILYADVTPGRYIITGDDSRTAGEWMSTVDSVLLEKDMIIQIDVKSDMTKSYSLTTPTDGTVLINLADSRRYKYLKHTSWHDVIKTKYGVGFWRLGFNSV